MAYSTTSDVQTILSPVGFTIGQTDPGTGTVDEPNNTTVNDILIPAADAVIDGRLRGLYAVPISNSTDTTLLKFISMQLAASMCAEYLFGDRADPDANTVLLTHRDRAMEKLDLLADGSVKLLTARASFLDDGVFSNFTEEADSSFTSAVKIAQSF